MVYGRQRGQELDLRTAVVDHSVPMTRSTDGFAKTFANLNDKFQSP